MLRHHVVEDGGDAGLGEFRVGEANYGFETAVEYGLLLLDVAELLVFDD